MAAMPVTAATTVPGAYVGHHQAQHNQHQANLREQFHNVSLLRDNGRSPHSRNMRSKENMGGLGKMFIWGIEGIHEFLETKSVMISTATVAPSFIAR